MANGDIIRRTTVKLHSRYRDRPGQSYHRRVVTKIKNRDIFLVDQMQRLGSPGAVGSGRL